MGPQAIATREICKGLPMPTCGTFDSYIGATSVKTMTLSVAYSISDANLTPVGPNPVSCIIASSFFACIKCGTPAGV